MTSIKKAKSLKTNMTSIIRTKAKKKTERIGGIQPKKVDQRIDIPSTTSAPYFINSLEEYNQDKTNNRNINQCADRKWKMIKYSMPSVDHTHYT